MAVMVGCPLAGNERLLRVVVVPLLDGRGGEEEEEGEGWGEDRVARKGGRDRTDEKARRHIRNGHFFYSALGIQLKNNRLREDRLF